MSRSYARSPFDSDSRKGNGSYFSRKHKIIQRPISRARRYNKSAWSKLARDAKDNAARRTDRARQNGRRADRRDNTRALGDNARGAHGFVEFADEETLREAIMGRKW